MIEVRLDEVTKRFGATQVLHRIDATIEAGSFAVLVGPSGCGKSTLLRLVAGLEEVSSGRILFGDRDVTAVPPRDRDLAMVFQSYALYPHMTVRQNVAFGLQLRRMPAADIAARVEEVAGMLGLQALLDRHPRALSGGQRQRVAMGRAIAKRAPLLLLDEPLSNLDPALRNQVRVEIRRLHERLGTTSIYVTHDQVEAMTLADRLFVLDGGVVQQTGRPLDVYRRPANRFVAGFVGSPAMNVLDAVVSVEGGRVAAVVGTGSDRLAIPIPEPDAFRRLTDGREVALGIRPHDVAPVEPTAQADLRLDVTLIETLGPDAHVHGTVAGRPFVACLPGDVATDRRGPLPLRITDLHLFDAADGTALR